MNLSFKEGFETCSECGGDGIETCNNPDHGYFDMISGYDGMSASEKQCPCCGFSENHKMKGICEFCNGEGRIKITKQNSHEQPR